jgi:2-dehydro-3-deoxygluconokinase
VDKLLDVITIGEPLVLLAAQQTGPLEDVDTFKRITAGAEFNVATGLARLGMRTAYIGQVGQDSFGRFLTSAMAREGIDHSQLRQSSQHRTGFMLKTRNDDGSDPAIEYFRKGSAASQLQWADIDAAVVTQARHLHLTGIYVGVSEHACALVFELAQQARAQGLSISFDPNLRPSLWPSQQAMIDCMNQLATLSNWVLPGLEEGRLLTGQHSPEAIADWYLARGAQVVVIKLGAQGAYYADAHQRGYAQACAVERVVDTVGAGDGFAAGLISGLLEGLDLASAAARGNAIGARVVQFPGDSDGLPDRSTLTAMMAQHPR